uniref:Uncharacterized protein n=1 Tax=uncultured prokaryote TaxID=198431 RepID=A0A0H5Q3K4_9ZZZZ|nr:hypothetical protein [uncultured prokaryote]
MAYVYSTRFVEEEVAAGGSGGIYTVPAGYVAVIRTVAITAQASGAGLGLLYRGGSIGLAALRSVTQYDTAVVNCRHVLNGGDVLNFAAFVVGFSVSVSGYLLEV